MSDKKKNNSIDFNNKFYHVIYSYLKKHLILLDPNCDSMKCKVLSIILDDPTVEEDYFTSHSLIEKFMGEQSEVNIKKDALFMSTKIMQTIGKDYLAPIVNELYETYLKHSGKKLHQKVCKPRDILSDENDISYEISKPIFLQQDSSSDEEEYNILVGIKDEEIPINDKLDRIIAGVEETKLLMQLKETELKEKLLIKSSVNESCPSLTADSESSVGQIDFSAQYLEFLLNLCQKSDKILDEMCAKRQEARRLEEEFCEIDLDWLEARVNAVIDKENLLTGQVMRAIYPDAKTINDCKAKIDENSEVLLKKEKVLEELRSEVKGLEVKRGPEWTNLAREYVKTRRKMQNFEKRKGKKDKY